MRVTVRKRGVTDYYYNRVKVGDSVGVQYLPEEPRTHAAKTHDTLLGAVQNAETAEIKGEIKMLARLYTVADQDFGTIARLEIEAVDVGNEEAKERTGTAAHR